MQVPDPDKRRRRVPVTQHLQRRVPNTQRILRRPLPIRILILQRWKYLIQMIIIRIPHIRPQNPVTPTLIKTELQVLCTQIQIWLGTRESKQQVPVREVSKLVAGGSRHSGIRGGRRRPRRIRQDRAVDEGGESGEKSRRVHLDGEKLLHWF